MNSLPGPATGDEIHDIYAHCSSSSTSCCPETLAGSLIIFIVAILLSGCAANTPKFSLGGTLYGLPSGASITLAN